MYLGLNPGIYFSRSGFRPTVDYLMFLGLSCGFKPRVDLFEVYGSEPRDNLKTVLKVSDEISKPTLMGKIIKIFTFKVYFKEEHD